MRRLHAFGDGNPIIKIPVRSAAEVTAHHFEINRVMNPEDGKRFLKAQDRISP